MDTWAISLEKKKVVRVRVKARTLSEAVKKAKAKCPGYTELESAVVLLET